MSQVASTAGKKAGLQIWRVENFSHAVVPDSQHGNFFSGDCYLILFGIESYLDIRLIRYDKINTLFFFAIPGI